MSIGIFQLLIILVIILLLFGAGKIPQIMSDIGKSIKIFKKSMKEEDNEIKEIENKSKKEEEGDS